jgi:uncharacterized damage-inducible protein DinB
VAPGENHRRRVGPRQEDEAPPVAHDERRSVSAGEAPKIVCYVGTGPGAAGTSTFVATAKGAPVKSHFSMMARYNAWANSRLYTMAVALPDESYRREVGVFFKSLHGTLNHLLVADRIWMRRLSGEGTHPDQLNAILFDDLASLRSARSAEDERLVDYVEGLSEADFENELEYRTLNGTPRRQPRREVLAHLFNHQTHHRGQAHAILTLVGVAEPDSLDLLVMQLAMK